MSPSIPTRGYGTKAVWGDEHKNFYLDMIGDVINPALAFLSREVVDTMDHMLEQAPADFTVGRFAAGGGRTAKSERGVCQTQSFTARVVIVHKSWNNSGTGVWSYSHVR